MTTFGALSLPDEWRELRAADVLYVCHDVDRTFPLGSVAYAPIVDSIQDLLAAEGLQGLTVATPYSLMTGSRAYGEVRSFNRAFALGAAWALAPGASRRLVVRTWERILRAVQPKGVIAIQPSRDLCEACSRLAIWVADAQHGWIPSDEIAGEPYYSRNYWRSGPDEPFPDYFLVWDEASAANLRKLFTPTAVTALCIGNVWCDRFARRDPLDAIVQQVPVHHAEAPRIVVTLQWKTVTIHDSLPASLRQVIQSTCSKYEWIIRLHPCETDSREIASVREALNAACHEHGGRVEWQRPTDQPLPAVLSRANVHITYNSSSALEASYFKVMTGFLDRRTAILNSGMSHLFAQHRAEQLPETASEIERWLERQVVAPRQGDAAGGASPAVAVLASLFSL
ncbi:MAG: hypothetical protein Q8O42_01985 [Acidobacteriota bacterium]|nr:hypothetical protein [Acidobacteriota bacterium]